MRHQQKKFRPHKKPIFYCDEDFPKPSLVILSDFQVKHSVLDFRFQGREDEFHYQTAFKNKSILITLDEDYLDNKRFKLSQTFGVIIIKVGQLANWQRVNTILEKLRPMLKNLENDSCKFCKIAVSLEGYTKLRLENNKIIKDEIAWRSISGMS